MRGKDFENNVNGAYLVLAIVVLIQFMMTLTLKMKYFDAF